MPLPASGDCRALTRLAFLGTPEVAVPPLRALVQAGHDVVLVVSQPDKRRGRGGGLVPSPVKRAAAGLGLATTDRVDDVLDAAVELGVVVAFGRLIKPHVLARVPMVNVHFSLLPRWRGAAPVERAILAGDTETGVCLMTLEEGLDTGPLHARRVVEIGPEETAAELRARLAEVGTELLVGELAAGLSPPEPQVGEPTYAAKIEPAELRLDWARPARELHRVVRLGGAWTTWRDRRLGIHRARWSDQPAAGEPGRLDGVWVDTGEGRLELVEVQPEGKPVLAAGAWRHGARLRPGEVLGR
jgi:methionyl-tRNA formyltransferase